MARYDEARASTKIKRSAMMITVGFYAVLFALLILGYQENLVDLFPDFIMEWMDGIFKWDTTPTDPAPQANGGRL